MNVTDPVCKMTIEDKDAIATSTYKSITYYFCSKPCKDDFDKDSTAYIDKKVSMPGKEELIAITS